MKEKLKISTYQEKVSDKWSRQHRAEYFGVSEYLIRKVRELKKPRGILSKPDQKTNVAKHYPMKP